MSNKKITIMKLKIFLYSIVTAFLIICCIEFKTPAEIEYIGTGYVQRNEEYMFVEINSIKYPLENIYSQNKNKKIEAHEGMFITAFTRDKSLQVEFMQGNCDKKVISSCFATSKMSLVVLSITLILLMISDIGEDLRSKKRLANKEK